MEPRFAFDRGVLEIMSPGPLHESQKGLMADFVKIVSRSLGIARLPMGSTTWGNEEAERGIEADECFYFAPEKIKIANEAIARKSNNSSDYPPPDMAVEVELSRPMLDRPAIYAIIRVAELWRYDGERLCDRASSRERNICPVRRKPFLPISAARCRALADRRGFERSLGLGRTAGGVGTRPGKGMTASARSAAPQSTDAPARASESAARARPSFPRAAP